MRKLTVLYDPSCRICRRARRWLESQRQWVALEFIGAGTPVALRRFTDLTVDDTLAELHVVGDDGSVYRGAKAWVLCLWALRDYRAWSVLFGRPEMLPRAQKFVEWVSSHRGRPPTRRA